MTAWWGNLPVSMPRAAVLQMLAGEAAERREERERQAAAEARREAAEQELRRYYMEHGEYPNDTMAREREIAARREAAELERAALERAERRQFQRAELIASGRAPRTVSEVLQTVALYP